MFVHVLEQAADKTLVSLHDAREFLTERLRFDGRTNPVQHEPCGLLSHTDVPVNLVRGHAVLAIGQHPNCHVPLAEADRRILKDRADADGELLLAALAAPHLARSNEARLRCVAQRAADAIRPAARSGVLKGRIRISEIDDGLLKSPRHIDAVRPRNRCFSLRHEDNIGPRSLCVKYVNTKHRPRKPPTAAWETTWIGGPTGLEPGPPA